MYHLLLILSINSGVSTIDTKFEYPTIESCQTAFDNIEFTKLYRVKGTSPEQMTRDLPKPDDWVDISGYYYMSGMCVPEK